MATVYTVFIEISISLLKEFNSVVSEPYMVLLCRLEGIQRVDLLALRMNCSISPRHKHTAGENLTSGIPKLQRLRDSTFATPRLECDATSSLGKDEMAYSASCYEFQCDEGSCKFNLKYEVVIFASVTEYESP
ncbi:hypothetical protein B0H14DRAFT_2561508 [Mycena olivaceomarginata]|nr:hypothetical protein B0H14DRAFT_2561508 [Mycena olivaceomarginata]